MLAQLLENTKKQTQFPKTMVIGASTIIINQDGGLEISGRTSMFGTLGIIDADYKKDVMRAGFGFPNEPIVDLFYRYGKCFYLTKAGKLYASGCNGYGQLGVGELEFAPVLRQVLLPDNEVVEDLLHWNDAAIFIRTQSGRVYAQGRNADKDIPGSYLGTASTDAHVVKPMLIELPASVDVIDIQPPHKEGSDSGLISTSDGLYVYGANRYGEFGLGHRNPVNKPVKITLPSETVKYFYTHHGDAYFFTQSNKIFVCGRSYRETPEPIENFLANMPDAKHIPIPLLILNQTGSVERYQPSNYAPCRRITLQFPDNDKIKSMTLCDDGWHLIGEKQDYYYTVSGINVLQTSIPPVTATEKPYQPSGGYGKKRMLPDPAPDGTKLAKAHRCS